MNLFLNKNSSNNNNKYNLYDTLDTELNENILDDKFFDTIYKNFRKRNISQRKSFENEKVFLSKEIETFRSNVYSQLLNEYSNIKIKPNITFTKLSYFMKFQKEKNFKIINCDKNVGNAILSNELYRSSVMEFLEKDITFSKITENPLYKTVNLIQTEINSLWENGHISTKLKRCLLSNILESRLGSFRLLAKLHKPKFSWRPIVNCKNHPNSKICLILDLLFKPIMMKTETYIKDSQNLIQKVKDVFFEKRPHLYSLDIVSLYTSIRKNHATRIITEFINEIGLNSFHMDIVALNKLLEIMFSTNVFKFEESFYRQEEGFPMGCICGPSAATIFVYILERKWCIIEKPLVYFRFIDDTFMALENQLNIKDFQKYFVYLEFTENTGNEINFLDLNISYDTVTNKLKFSVYIKPTNSFNYLRKNSDHAVHVFKGIPNNLFIRNRKICSYYSDYISICKIYIDRLIKLGHKRTSLIKLCKSIGHIDRNSLLPYKENINKFFSPELKNILYFDTFNFNLNIKSIIYNKFKQIFNENNYKLIYIQKNKCNINNAFVHNQKISIIKKYRTKKCLEKNCKACKYIYTHYYFKLDKHNDVKIKLMNNTSCNTKNLIYVIICNRCNLFYVGETAKSLKERTSQHINHILNFVPYRKYENKEVARHFRSKGHKINDFKIFGFKSDLESDEIRKNMEQDLINKLNTNKIRCINKIVSKRSKKFIFK